MPTPSYPLETNHVYREGGFVEDINQAFANINDLNDRLSGVNGNFIRAEDGQYATPQDALNDASAGDVVIFGESHTLSGGTVYTVPVGGITIVVSAGVELEQTVWAKPVFDGPDVDDVTVLIYGKLTFTGTRGDAAVPSPFRGEAGYLYGAGVWTNGNGWDVRGRVSGFTCGVYLSARNISGAVWAPYKKNNRVDLIVDNVDFGVNWLGQEDLTVAVTARDIVTTTNGGPPHAIYGSGNDTLRSRRVHVERAVCTNNPDSNAFQIKYCDGLTIPAMLADNCPALFNFVDVTDVAIGVGVLASPSGSQTVLGDFQRINAAKNTNISIGRLILHQQTTTAAAMYQALSVVGAGVTIGSVMVVTNNTDAVTSTGAVYLNGTNISLDELIVHNQGYGTVPVVIGESAATDQVTVRRIKTRNATNGIANVQHTATNVLLEYAPQDIVGLDTAVSYTVRPINGSTVGFTTRKVPYERFWSLSGGTLASSKKPEPHLETVTHYKLTDTNAYTIPAPGDTYPWVGMTHDIAIENASGGTLGAITWNAAWSLNGSFNPPANGYTTVIRFRWNGTIWAQVELDDSGPVTTAWVAPTLLNSWANYGGSFQNAGYRKNGDVVEIRGTVKSGTINPIFTLPAGFRPPAIHSFICSSNNGYDIAYVEVNTSGDVKVFGYNAGGNNSFVSLAQIRFSVTS